MLRDTMLTVQADIAGLTLQPGQHETTFLVSDGASPTSPWPVSVTLNVAP